MPGNYTLCFSQGIKLFHVPNKNAHLVGLPLKNINIYIQVPLHTMNCPLSMTYTISLYNHKYKGNLQFAHLWKYQVPLPYELQVYLFGKIHSSTVMYIRRVLIQHTSTWRHHNYNCNMLRLNKYIRLLRGMKNLCKWKWRKEQYPSFCWGIKVGLMFVAVNGVVWGSNFVSA